MLETLESLRCQRGGHTYEVIVADRRNDDISRTIEENYPEVRLIACPPETSLPELRAIALDHAAGQFVVVTEDHCIPANDWLESIALAFSTAPPQTAAVGGCVENGVHDTALDWATFFCEYGFFLAPITEGPTLVLPGMNVAYVHSVLQNIDRSVLTGGFWETTLHPMLLNTGKVMISTPTIKLYHSKKFSFTLFVRQRFLYSRHYAGHRFGRHQMTRRLIAFVATPVLPLVLLYRLLKQIGAKNRLRLELVSALPILVLFVMVWAWGEMVGYALGAGDALAKIE